MLTRSQSRRPKPTQAHIDLGDGDSLNIVFDRNAVTPAWIDGAQQKAENDSDIFALAGAIAEVVESWDLFEDDGVTPVPVSTREIGGLSFDTCAALLRELVQAAAPSRAEGNASSVPSSTHPSDFGLPASTHPNGADTSQLPTPSESPSLT